MQEDFIHLGERLKMKRQERQISLKEVENGTSIRMNFLAAIEEGQLGKLISPVYAQGFIKKYANFLELDGDALLREYPSVMRYIVEQDPEKQEFAYGIGSLEVRGTPAGEVKWLPNFVWVAGSAFGLVVIWFIARSFHLI